MIQPCLVHLRAISLVALRIANRRVCRQAGGSIRCTSTRCSPPPCCSQLQSPWIIPTAAVRSHGCGPQVEAVAEDATADLASRLLGLLRDPTNRVGQVEKRSTSQRNAPYCHRLLHAVPPSKACASSRCSSARPPGCCSTRPRAGEPRPTAAIVIAAVSAAAVPTENPHCSCKLTLTAAIPTDNPCCSCKRTLKAAIIPTENPYCGCKPTRVRPRAAASSSSQSLRTYSCNPCGESVLRLQANTCSMAEHVFSGELRLSSKAFLASFLRRRPEPPPDPRTGGVHGAGADYWPEWGYARPRNSKPGHPLMQNTQASHIWASEASTPFLPHLLHLLQATGYMLLHVLHLGFHTEAS